MARQEINLGAAPTGAGGDTTRSTAVKINAMTLELYQGIGTPTAPLPVSLGGTGGASQATAQTGLGLVKVTSSIDSTSGNLLLAGWGGLGGQLQSRSYTPDQMFTTQAGGSFAYGNNGGTYPTGVTDGALINMGYDTAGQFAYQILGDWRTGYMYRRGRAGGTSGAWGMIYDSINSLVDPAGGGLMSSTVVNGYTVTKYASGIMNIVGPAGNTASIGAGAVGQLNVTIPAGFISTNYMVASAIIAATVSNDHYGVISIINTNLTTLAILVRNGPSAQAFEVRLSVWGRWK